MGDPLYFIGELANQCPILLKKCVSYMNASASLEIATDIITKTALKRLLVNVFKYVEVDVVLRVGSSKTFLKLANRNSVLRHSFCG